MRGECLISEIHTYVQSITIIITKHKVNKLSMVGHNNMIHFLIISYSKSV